MKSGELLEAREAKLRAIAKASRYQFPTADMEVMLSEIESGRDSRGFPCASPRFPKEVE